MRTGPAGAKGIGELPMDGPAPAIAQRDRPRNRMRSCARCRSRPSGLLMRSPCGATRFVRDRG